MTSSTPLHSPQSSKPNQRQRARGPLRDRRFFIIWAGQSCSQFGSAIAPIALTLGLLHDGGSAGRLGLVLAVMVFFEAVSALPGGVWADRLPRNRLMVGSEAVRTVSQLFIAVELMSGSADTVSLVVAAGCTGAASGVFQPSATGLVQSLVPRDQLQRANALMSISQRVSMVAGPTVATSVALAFGAGWGLVIDSGTFVVSAISLIAVPVAHVDRPRERFAVELKEGWREVRRHRWYWTNLISHAVWNLGRCVFFTVGALVVVGSLGGELAWGSISEVGAVGALAGALVAWRVRLQYPLITANVCLALGCLPLLLIAAHASVPSIAVATGLMNSALGLSGTLWNSSIQSCIPVELISRVGAFDWLTSTALNPMAMALAGPLALAIGSTATLYLSAVLVVLSSLGVLAVPEVRRLRVAPEDAQEATGT